MKTPLEVLRIGQETRLKMSYEEFLAWIDEDVHAEWVEGEVTVFMPPKDIHQATLGFLHQLLGIFVDLFGLGKLRIAPFEVRLSPRSSREPDILFIANKSLAQLTQERFEGAPDLILEIISRDSINRDRIDKFSEYQAAGVTEYWIIDPRPDQRRADFYQLDENGLYQIFATQADNWITSTVLAGFQLRPEWLWQADSLSPLTCALQIEGVAPKLLGQIDQARSDSSTAGE